MRATIAALRAMSWDGACKVGEQLGELGYRPLGIRKRVVERQIAAAFPDLTPEAVVNLARESYRHLGRTFIETALLAKLGKDGLQELVETVDGWEEIDDVMAKGKGAVMVPATSETGSSRGRMLPRVEFRSTRSCAGWPTRSSMRT